MFFIWKSIKKKLSLFFWKSTFKISYPGNVLPVSGPVNNSSTNLVMFSWREKVFLFSSSNLVMFYQLEHPVNSSIFGKVKKKQCCFFKFTRLYKIINFVFLYKSSGNSTWKIKTKNQFRKKTRWGFRVKVYQVGKKTRMVNQTNITRLHT